MAVCPARGREMDWMKNSMLGAQGCVTICPPFMSSNTANWSPLLRWSLHCGIHTVAGGSCENGWTPKFKKRRLHGELVQKRGKCPQNQSHVGSSGQRLTTNVSPTVCNWQMWRQTHVLCGRTTFRTQLNYVHNYYSPYTYCSLDEGVAYTRGEGGGLGRSPALWATE